ncbi:CaiB/BaiF CoA transferase family protein [Cryptosporangium phraense]|uniref:CoA transferase n=1 Tax=Cryptosporangium phraense TaxID=2593070 RepID=A0A545AII3_9ACTN|nr:CoA transferase [Cryptosporangium phraense]TQS41136.1 CoA transferase [Cryptosporangium phraense]
MTAGQKPLRGRVVLDLTTALAGPYATLLLAGLGATVIKIENPATGGDSSRNNAPYLGEGGLRPDRGSAEDMSVSVIARARNKQSITLNLKQSAARAVFLELVEHADIVVENYAAGTADRLGIGHEACKQVNPRIIYASISGFGAQGAPGSGKAMDSIIQALSGVMFTSGEPDSDPVRVGLPVADLLAPLFAVIGVLSAVIEVEQGGTGQQVDVSMLGALTSLLSIEPFDAFEQLGLPTRTGRTLPRLAPFGLFPAADGWVALCAPTDTFAAGVFRALGTPELADDPRFRTRDRRVGNATDLHAQIDEWTSKHTTEEIVALLAEQGVPAAPVREPADAIHDDLVRQRGEVVDLEHPDYGATARVSGPGLPIRFSESAAGFDRPAPRLGEHTDEILRTLLGYDAEQIAALRQNGAL